MTGNTDTSVQNAFFVFAKDRIGLSPKMLTEYLQKAADFCHSKQPLLGMTDVKAVRNIQQKVAEGKLLRFRFGKDAQTIRNVTQLYYTFVKSYREPKEETTVPFASETETTDVNHNDPITRESTSKDTPEISSHKFTSAVENEHIDEHNEEITVIKDEEKTDVSTGNLLTVDFDRDNSYLFTKPVTYTYKGQTYPAKSWNRIYVEICGLLFSDYLHVFMGIMNGDIPGYNTLAFADEQNYRRMRVPKSFAPGYYLESNLDATSIVRKLRGLHQLMGIGNDLQIVYQTLDGYLLSQQKEHRIIRPSSQLIVDDNYDWHRSGILLVDLSTEASYAFTQPEAYEYNGVTRRVNKWGKLYADLCGLLFEDHRDAFMGIMNGDIPGYSSLAFADEQHKGNLRVARQFAPGYYLESNMDATTIVRRIRGLSQLFNLGDILRIAYTNADDTKPQVNLDNSSEEWIINRLKELKMTYQDKRNIAGCLWIIGGHELDRFMLECKSHGYEMHYKVDGYKSFPGKAAWWTTSRTTPVQKKESQSTTVNIADLDSFKQFLQNEQHLAERTANSYCSAIRAIDDMLKQNNPGLTILCSDPDAVQNTIDRLIKSPSFGRTNEERHHQLSAALAQYLSYVKNAPSKKKAPTVQKERTIIEAVFEALKIDDLPLTFQQINDAIIQNDLYHFNTPNSIGMIRHAVYTHCLTTKERIANGETVIIQVSTNGLNKYQLMSANEASLFLYGKPAPEEKPESKLPKPVAEQAHTDRDEKLIVEAEKLIAKADLDGMTVEELAYRLDSTVVAAKKAVADTTNIVTIDGRLIHKDAFMDWEENADILEGILDKLMTKNNGYVSYEQLYDYARMDMQMFINDHDMDSPRKIYDLAEHLFDKECYHGKRYSFIGKTHISRKGEAVTSKLDIMKKFARDNGGIFTMHELEDYLTNIGVKNENLRQQMKLYEQPIFLYIEEGTFITAESMGLNDAYLAKIHIALKRLFSDGGDHVVLRDIQTSWFNLLPALPQGKEWTPLLLQSVLRFYSKECGARTIYGLVNQAGDTLHAMVVSNRSEIQSFGDAVIAILIDSGISQRHFEAEDLRHLLVDRGMVAGNELIWNMPKALPNDGRFAWDNDGQHVTINI